jgi:protease I
MSQRLLGKKVAILVDNDFEQVEMTEPRRALINAGADTFIISPQKTKVKGWNHTDWGDEFVSDITLDLADPYDYDALLIPGGVMSPDALRMNSKAVDFVRSFFEENKPVASICHGPWMLVEADVVDGRTLASWPSLKTDIENAGADWVDQEVVVDNGMVTSRNPGDIPAFNIKMVEEFAEGEHAKQFAT